MIYRRENHCAALAYSSNTALKWCMYGHDRPVSYPILKISLCCLIIPCTGERKRRILDQPLNTKSHLPLFNILRQSKQTARQSERVREWFIFQRSMGLTSSAWHDGEADVQEPSGEATFLRACRDTACCFTSHCTLVVTSGRGRTAGHIEQSVNVFRTHGPGYKAQIPDTHNVFVLLCLMSF